MVLPHFAELYSMAINLRLGAREVKRDTTRSCGVLHTKHNILRKYSCLQKVTRQGPSPFQDAFPPPLPPDIRLFPTGIPQAFAQRPGPEILSVSALSPHELHRVFVLNISSAARTLFRQLFRRD